MMRTLTFVTLSCLFASSLHGSCHDRDEDHDGVNSCDDRCPDTPPGDRVDSHGCSCGILDDDGDGVSNCEDPCYGADNRVDTDGDGIPDCLDLCPGSEAGATVDDHGCSSVYVNWESPHVHPMDITPDGSMVLIVNTAGHQLEVLGLASKGPRSLGSVPVGLEPVTVRALSNSEAWVVNHVSDSVSIVDLKTLRVRATLSTGNEPCDVVFSGAPERAFVSIAQLSRLEVYDPANLAAPPVFLPLDGESPRSLATDGKNIYVAFFESGKAEMATAKRTPLVKRSQIHGASSTCTATFGSGPRTGIPPMARRKLPTP